MNTILSDGDGVRSLDVAYPVLECHKVSKAFDGVRAVDEVTLRCSPGAITALVGPNGAGKTTLFNLLSGTLQADSGDVFFKRQSIRGIPPWKLARNGIGRLFQDVRVFERLSVLDNVLVAAAGPASASITDALFRRSRISREQGVLLDRARTHLAEVGLLEAERRPAAALSFGQQKLLALCRLLAQESELLLLDEPAAGVAPAMRELLGNVVRTLARKGRTILMIEHDMELVKGLAQHIVSMANGRVVAAAPTSEFLNQAAATRAAAGL